MYEKLSTIQTAISKLGGTKISTSYYWSSTERYNSDAWHLYFTNGGRGSNFKYGSWVYVRPVLSF